MTHLYEAIRHLRVAQPSEIDALPPRVAEQFSELLKTWWLRTVPTRHLDPDQFCFTCSEAKTIVDGNGDEHPCPDCKNVKRNTPQAA